MSPQVKVSYFGQGEDGALGRSVLYLTGVGTYRLLALCNPPLSSMWAGEGLRGAECEPTTSFPTMEEGSILREADPAILGV